MESRWFFFPLVHCSFQCLEPMVGTEYIFVKLINQEIVNVGMRSSFVAWSGAARCLGIQ